MSSVRRLTLGYLRCRPHAGDGRVGPSADSRAAARTVALKARHVSELAARRPAFLDALHSALDPDRPSPAGHPVAGRREARISPKRPVHLASVCRSLWARCNGTEQTVMLA